MQSIQVSKEELLKVLKRNREAHKTVFEKAYSRFIAAVERELRVRLQRIREGKSVSLMINLPEPRDMSHHYNRVIEMLKMDIRDEVELTQQEFQQFVQDDWTWAREFATTASLYGVRT